MLVQAYKPYKIKPAKTTAGITLQIASNLLLYDYPQFVPFALLSYI